MLDMRRGNLMILLKSREHVHHGTYAKVRDLYEKLQHVDPRDHGVTEGDMRRAKTWASKKGCAPISCWDDDTIDDPEAWPEWTGLCGTLRGRKLHYEYKIPLCHNCRMADFMYRKFPCLAHKMNIVGERAPVVRYN